MHLHFKSLADFINMGGYSFYVWSSYLISLFAVIGIFIFFNKQTNNIKKKQKSFKRRAEIKFKS